MPGKRLRQTSLSPGGVLTERQSHACEAKLREWRLENEAEHAGITVAELLSVHEAEREREAERVATVYATEAREQLESVCFGKRGESLFVGMILSMLEKPEDLAHAERVCRRWREMGADDSL